MAIREVFEIEEPQHLLHTRGAWRVTLDTTTGDVSRTDEGGFVEYTRGDVAVFVVPMYVDADRAGFSGYLPERITLPVSVLLAAADAIRAGEVPREDG